MRRRSGPRGGGCDGSWGFQAGHAVTRHTPYRPERPDPPSPSNSGQASFPSGSAGKA